jgi:hypothetical protein
MLSDLATPTSRTETDFAPMARCRWCVTGTPIGAGGVHDIHGLLCVLKYKPYDDASVFE